jgi:imidazolonepropionase-like amidohydrolase
MRRLFAILLLILLPAQIFCQSAESSQYLVLKNVTIIDMTGAPLKAQMTVIIENGRITGIGKTTKTKAPKNAQIIDAAGKFLIPSFWDMHVHVLDAERSLPMYVANGVLGVRDLGVNHLDDILLWREETAAGKIIAPRIVTAGKILDGEPSASPDYSIVVKTPEEARKAVRDLKSRGVDLIKVYDVLSREAYFAIADEAKKLNLPFVGHVPSSITTIEASDAGQKSIEHLGKILEDSTGSPEEMQKVRSIKTSNEDFSSFPRKIAKVYEVSISTYSPEKASEIFAHFVKNKTWQVPTLITKYGRTYVDDLDKKGDWRAKYIPESDRQWWKPTVGFFFRYRTPEYIEAQKKYFQKELELCGAMHRAGVKFLAGTDTISAYTYAGFSLHDELALLVQAGFSPMDALLTATRNPAEYFGELKTSGTVEKGKIANLILLEENPLADIRNTTKINAVIQNSKYLSKETLQKMLADVEALANKK